MTLNSFTVTYMLIKVKCLKEREYSSTTERDSQAKI